VGPPPVLPPERGPASPAACAPNPVVTLPSSYETLAAPAVARAALDQACLHALDLDALAQRARPVRGKHPLTCLPLYEPSVEEWQQACADVGVPWPGAPAYDLADSVRGVDRVVDGLRRLAERGPDADLAIPPRAAFEAALTVHTRSDLCSCCADVRGIASAGGVHSHHVSIAHAATPAQCAPDLHAR
jgi:hypothetical protein